MPRPRAPAEPSSSEPTLAAAVRELAGVPWSRARAMCVDGRVTVDGVRCLDPASRVRQGAVVAIEERGLPPRDGPLSEDAILYYDRDLVVVNKPAGLLSIPDVAGNRD